ncbi:putative white-brown complex homolog protein 30 [Cornus florida]|uniref:putative white-brown complex homolog protein 30 n=1 Tax=Cornus florida TaxID=4283 RepID=UPI0028A1ADCD|nr:putative white-brown complex homolog protein 30 [Cornus florida]
MGRRGSIHSSRVLISSTHRSPRNNFSPSSLLKVCPLEPPTPTFSSSTASSPNSEPSIIDKKMQSVTLKFTKKVEDKLGFCISDVEKEWDRAFNYSKNLDFVQNCILQIKGDLAKRLCTASEIKFYFESFLERASLDAPEAKPNKNCNLTSWVPGCLPGWASGLNSADEKVDLTNSSRDMPARTNDSQPCCEGFFCPQGITCMIPCPLGSYCPLGKLNNVTGICDPYHYRPPPGQTNYTCGGADVWADVLSSGQVFCSAGSYCPTTIEKVTCSSGYYCRMGSTSQKPCSALSTCDPNTANQNLEVYGIIIIATLSVLLLLIYTCSDQVLSIRDERLAKSREAAARSARETAQARERWKSAKNVAIKRAVGLQQQFSCAFSRKTSFKQPEQLNVIGQAKAGSNEASLPPKIPSNSSIALQPSVAPKAKRKEPSNLTNMLQSLENDSDSNQGFNLEIGDKNIKKQIPKNKLHTRSQIFKYAYGELEKEKAKEQKGNNLTFTGVLSMATNSEIRTRPLIEVAFKDLTLTLKRKNKHLLRCVTGKIMPGRVSAVMGPSGAGKTTFLSALTGKATGCTMSGLILINRKVESIHSYKKVIGFVPQDDIVHGNLTVEENLRFSAECRLSADMPKADRVLIVERVIESLGLQAVRDSLVGTVEKRGISGGQRKRVNVGLEMVMEPSLLILDEPTSGLDSASSNLLLRALRREALEGVNICMVVHQPSYALFRMFDDLILLAKGGLTVYHGSVKKVEGYFAGLGIIVPERVNPPDHFIDILEGIVQPVSGVTVQQLPVRWMLHNGYPVPPEMMHYCDEIAASSKGVDPGADEATEQPVAGDLCQDVKCNVKHQHNFKKSHDLTNRVTPGVFRQYRYFLGRVSKQRLRESKIQAADYLILLLGGVCLGTIAKITDETFGALGYTYTVIAVSLLCKIAALRTFSLDKLHYWRESASGMSSLAYFLSKDTIDHFNTVVKPLVYLSMFYFFNSPRSSFMDNYIVLLCLVYCVTGIAYVFAILLEPGSAQLWCVLLPVNLTLIANQNKKTQAAKLLGDYVYPKFAMEAFTVANAERYSGVWLITRCGLLLKRAYNVNNWTNCVLSLMVTGIVSRFIAFFCMIKFQKK